jgi:hypothetical protein
MSKDKPIIRDKKKGNNGNVPVSGNGGENGSSNMGNGNDTSGVGIKSEPMERERERGEEEVKEEPPTVEESEHVDDSNADVKPPDLLLPDCELHK